MNKTEYLISKMSYENAENSRILNACLKNWFDNPKILNFVSPSLDFPFKYTQWLKLYKSMTKRNIDNQSYIIQKNESLIVGYISLFFNNEFKETNIFHLIIDPQFQGKGLSKKLFEFVENVAIKENFGSMSLYVNRKNNSLTNLVENLGYKPRKLNKKVIYYTKIIT